MRAGGPPDWSGGTPTAHWLEQVQSSCLPQARWPYSYGAGGREATAAHNCRYWASGWRSHGGARLLVGGLLLGDDICGAQLLQSRHAAPPDKLAAWCPTARGGRHRSSLIIGPWADQRSFTLQLDTMRHRVSQGEESHSPGLLFNSLDRSPSIKLGQMTLESKVHHMRGNNPGPTGPVRHTARSSVAAAWATQPVPAS